MTFAISTFPRWTLCWRPWCAVLKRTRTW